MASFSIYLTPNTPAALNSGGYSIYIFQAVQAAGNPVNGQPVLWLQIDQFSGLAESIEPVWNDHEVLAFTTDFDIPDLILPDLSKELVLGQTLQVQSESSGTVVSGGSSTAFTIENQTSSQITCGIQYMPIGDQGPLCVFQLEPNTNVAITPLNQFVLFVSKIPITAGQIVPAAFGSGVLVSAMNADLTYDINSGWSGAPMTSVPEGADLTSLLIQNGS